MKRKRLRAEVILVEDRIGESTSLSAVAKFWTLSKETVEKIESDARKGICKAPVACGHNATPSARSRSVRQRLAESTFSPALLILRLSGHLPILCEFG